jgi:hypothetical protein
MLALVRMAIPLCDPWRWRPAAARVTADAPGAIA